MVVRMGCKMGRKGWWKGRGKKRWDGGWEEGEGCVKGTWEETFDGREEWRRGVMEGKRKGGCDGVV